MKALSVPDMHCEMCVKRIDKALTDAGIDHTIDLYSKTVSVSEESADKAIAELDDIGFEAK